VLSVCLLKGNIVATQALFGSAPRGAIVSAALTTNAAGGTAYVRTDESALAQLALTGTFNDTYYATAKAQFESVLELAQKVPPLFLAKCAIYARERGYMKDMPAFLLAVLTTRDSRLVEPVFKRVITNGKMLRNFVQIMRSGAVGRKSLGTLPKRLVQNWLNEQSIGKLLKASIGNSPSLADIVKMVHPKPSDALHEQFYKWLTKGDVPAYRPIQEYTSYVAALTAKKKPAGLIGGGEVADPLIDMPLPNVPMEMLFNLELTDSGWKQLAQQMTWNQLRLNLNKLEREGLFKDPEQAALAAAKLADAEAIHASKVFPYQLMTTYLNVNTLPPVIHTALATALDHALVNVPLIEQTVLLCPDVSGSMSNPITGGRPGATTKTRNIDVAALITAAFVRRCPKVAVLPFDDKVYDGAQILSKGNTVMQNAAALASIRGGATACYMPILALLEQPDYFPMDEDGVIILVSDNESWSDNRYHYSGQKRTALLDVWRRFRAAHPKAKLICIDISPNTTSQVPDEPGVLNIGGFSDNVFTLIDDFVNDRNTTDSLKASVESVELETVSEQKAA
jgi:60 kDa SS-A/Ro ribonucleoprotein